MIVALARKLLIEMPGCLLLTTGLLHSNGMTTLELQTTDRGGGNPTLDYGLRAAV